jgi:hypothetical protein
MTAMVWVNRALEGRFLILTLAVAASLLMFAGLLFLPGWRNSIWLPFVVFAGLALVGIRDILQTKRAILRNYPIIGHLRFFFEKIRPEMRQYFFEADTDGRPFPREKRAIVYQTSTRQEAVWHARRCLFRGP